MPSTSFESRSIICSTAYAMPACFNAASLSIYFEIMRVNFEGIDAAIGGTGSDLGVFRMDEDLMKYNPDFADQRGVSPALYAYRLEFYNPAGADKITVATKPKGKIWDFEYFNS